MELTAAEIKRMVSEHEKWIEGDHTGNDGAKHDLIIIKSRVGYIFYIVSAILMLVLSYLVTLLLTHLLGG